MLNDFIATTCSNEIAQRLSHKRITDDAQVTCKLCGTKAHLYQCTDDVMCSVCILFRTPIKQFTKDGSITIKQKDTILILRKDKSYLLGDIDIPARTGDKVQIITPDITNKWRDFIADYIVEEHDSTKQSLLIIQSKADKSDTFSVSQGDILSVCGQLTATVNTKLIKRLALQLRGCASLKRENLNSYVYHVEQERWLDGMAVPGRLININKKLVALENKFPVLAEVKKLLPMNGSDDMQMLSWCLSR